MPSPATTVTRQTGQQAARWAELLAPTSARSTHLPTSNCLQGKRVLITGCGGSIGSALSHAAAASGPRSLVLVDSSESALYYLDRSLRRTGSTDHIPVLGSVCSPSLLSHLFAQHAPEIVLHAAALKHVPLMEHNPFAAIETNVLGTLNVAQAALAHQSEHLLLVSTDKAVAPHSIMGASKRIAELILLAHGSPATRMTTLRLCNVIGSQGSVLPLFLDQLSRELPLTVTHPDASRYFITLEVAIHALLAALESQAVAAIFLPQMVAELHILDLAHHLIHTHGSASTVEFTGLRSGDKLSERLLSDAERLSSQPAVLNPGLYEVEGPTPSREILAAAILKLRAALDTYHLPGLIAAVQTLVPEYRPSPALLQQQPTTQVYA